MLAYAAPRPGREAAHPKTLVLIVAAHAVAISAVMLARSDLPARFRPTITTVETIAIPPDPPPNTDQPQNDPKPIQVTTTHRIVDVAPRPNDDPIVTASTSTGVADGTGTASLPIIPTIDPVVPPHEIVRRGPTLTTRGDAIRPPYPDSKRMLAEEATLTLKLTIDAAGRVTAVDSIGAADPAFLDSARKHLLRVWRFTPATEDGQAVPSTRVITLRFQLEDD